MLIVMSYILRKVLNYISSQNIKCRVVGMADDAIFSFYDRHFSFSTLIALEFSPVWFIGLFIDIKRKRCCSLIF